MAKKQTQQQSNVAAAKSSVSDVNTTAPAQKPYLMVAGIVFAIIAALYIDATRAYISSIWSTWFGAIFILLVTSGILFLCVTLLSTEEWRGGGVAGLYNHADYDKQAEVKSAIESFKSNFSETTRSGDGSHDEKLKQRQKNYMNMVNHFYDLVTDFYEYGWGDCFHFGFRFAGEGFQESIRRTEYYLASRIGMNASHTVVDVGCGVGGPMRNIARFTQSKVVGINNNAYQIKVGTKHNVRLGLDHLCSFLQSDFMKINVPDNTYDHAYAIEATCHAPDKAACYAEIYRMIKPGGYFGCYDWCVTEKYDKNNPKHVSCREGIEVGNSLPVLATFEEVKQALVKAGFEVCDAFNAQKDAHAGPNHIPWYQSLAGEYTSLTGFRMTPVGRSVTHAFVTLLEAIKIAPAGSVQVSQLLNDTAIDLVNGGRMEIFTPSYFFLARKPLNA